jgi:hypothetical protein
MQRYLGIFLLDASLEVLEPSFPEFPESGLGVHCTPSPDEPIFLVVGVGGPANAQLHTHTCQAFLFQEIDLVTQGNHLRSFEQSRLFTLGSLEHRQSACEGGEAGFVVLTVEPCSMPSPKSVFQGKIKKTSMRASL